MVRQKTRPLRSLAPEETGCIVSITAAAGTGGADSADVNASTSSPSLVLSLAGQQKPRSPSPLLSAFWPVPSSTASNGSEVASQHAPAGKAAKPNSGIASNANGDGSSRNGVGKSSPTSIKHESFDESDDDDDMEDDYCHPLSRMHGMPAFSDLQGTSADLLEADVPPFPPPASFIFCVAEVLIDRLFEPNSIFPHRCAS